VDRRRVQRAHRERLRDDGCLGAPNDGTAVASAAAAASTISFTFMFLSFGSVVLLRRAP